MMSLAMNELPDMPDTPGLDHFTQAKLMKEACQYKGALNQIDYGIRALQDQCTKMIDSDPQEAVNNMLNGLQFAAEFIKGEWL